MSPLVWPDKDPAETLEYALDWREVARLQDGEALAPEPEGVTWTVPAPLVEVARSQTETVAVIILGGGTAGRRYRIACKIATTYHRTYKRTIRLLIKAK